MKKQRRTFSAEFKLEAASLVLDQGYSMLNTGVKDNGHKPYYGFRKAKM